MNQGWSKVNAFCWLAAAAVATAGCQQPTIMPDPKLVPAQAPRWFDDRDWATVLRENVRDGAVDYEHLSKHREVLDRHVALISAVGPRSTPKLFPSRKHRLAYWINAYNAVALRIALERYPTESVYDLLGPSFEHDFALQVDGESMSLSRIRDQVLKERAGDLRVLFCLCAAAQGSPPLPNQPMRADTLNRQLEAAARQAMDNPRLIRIEHETQRLLVWQRMAAMREAFVREYEVRMQTREATLLNVLMRFADDRRRRELNTAIGYVIGVIPYDRSLNQWAPPSSAQ